MNKGYLVHSSFPVPPSQGLPWRIAIRQATTPDAQAVSDILQEAAAWLISRGQPLWQTGELAADSIQADVTNGNFWLATADGCPAGCVKFQLQDELFWPDVPSDDSAFIHRLAVRRQFAGGEISTALLTWAKGHAAALGRSWLRLDTVADRPTLRAVYERFGFQLHSYRQVGPYYVARYQIATR